MSSDQYNTDIEMVMDFMKLSLLFDDSNISQDDRIDVLKLQKSILELLPVAQSNRMSAAYDMLRNIYRQNKKEYIQQQYTKTKTLSSPIPDKRNDHYILLFYKSLCPACKRIMDTWGRFKHQHMSSNFTIIDYDAMDPKNQGIFEQFKIESVPTIFKLKLDTTNYIQKMMTDITLENLNNFANFN